MANSGQPTRTGEFFPFQGLMAGEQRIAETWPEALLARAGAG